MRSAPTRKDGTAGEAAPQSRNGEVAVAEAGMAAGCRPRACSASESAHRPRAVWLVSAAVGSGHEDGDEGQQEDHQTADHGNDDGNGVHDAFERIGLAGVMCGVGFDMVFPSIQCVSYDNCPDFTFS